MHADEAILADKFGTLLERGTYAYDPTEYHGPLVAYVSTLPAYLSGRTTYVALTEQTLRVAPAIAGILLSLAPLLFAGAIGERGVLCAALLVSVSPACVFYSRYYIPEMLLALLTAAFLFALWRLSLQPTALAWASAGAAAAAMLATKETAIVALTAAGIPFVAFVRPRFSLWFLVAFAVALVLLINPILLLQSYAGYWQRGITTVMHDHPAHYYLGLIGREAVVLATAIVGFVMPAPHRFTRVLKWYALLLIAIYSAIPYKTPWIVVSMIFALALLAAIGIPRILCKARILTGTLLLAGVAHLVWQSYTASFLRPADPRNPWVYAQTGTDVFAIRDAVQRYGKNVPIGIYTRENFWPLPWYLRGNEIVRWSREVVMEGTPPPIVLGSPEMEPALQKKFYEGPPPGQREMYMTLFRQPVYLRPGVEVRGYVRKSLWDEAAR